MASRLVLLLSLASLILFSALITPALSKTPAADEDDEDLSFLEEDGDGASKHASPDHHFDEIDGEDDFSDQEDSYDEFDASSNFDQPDGGYEEDQLGADEKDVVVLGGGNFTDFIKSNKYVMVEFYAPWCGHCMSLAPEYAAAATELKDGVHNETVSLVKVDATEESDLAEQYEVQGFPTVLFFINGEHKPYNGARSKDAIVTWIKKKIGPGVVNVTTVDDAERILTSEDKLVLGFFNSLVSPESDEFAAASKLEDDVNFYQTENADVAKLFHIESNAKRPALLLLKKEAEKVTPFDGEFTKSAIVEFISANKLPLVITFTRETAPQIFESSIKKQLLLFANSNESEKFVPIFQEAAKVFKGKLVFVNVELDNEDTGKPVAEYFGVEGEGPTVLGFTGTDDAKKFILDKEFNLENIKAFAADFVEDKLKPFYKSDPVPETNDGDVKIIVGNNFDEIVLDESKDVLLEIYAPWCGHCQSLEPTYNKLAKHLQPIESLVIAKMDGTTNEHPRVKAEGFPTLLFFPAGKKSSDPITVEADRTVVALYKFLKKHATVPFKLEKPAVTPTPEVSDATEGAKSSPEEVKDEL